ncbi:MAG: LacI family DNA-binding transcriptional regulator [Oscillospiraceae bacterium]|nr:LacI family DNA-binding transcriptional regulator [Oscillospiraceae bacterium]
MATLEDIAKALGVSKGTVSKALNGAKDVSSTMRNAVLEKAVELGYTRSIRRENGQKIALFITNMEYARPDDFGYDLVAGVRKAAEPAGFQVDLIPLTIQMQQETAYDSYMVQNQYCGGLFLGLSLRQDPWMKDFESCKTPTVLYDNHVSCNPNVTYIGTNNQEGMDLAIEYLKSLGHQKIGYLSYELHAYIYQRRYYAYLQAMLEHGLQSDPALTGSEHHVSDCLGQHLPRLLKQGCTAIICSHDILAHSVMVHCQELGLRVPEDVSILGFDDIPLCRYAVPPLSTIRQDRENLGRSAFHALTSQMNQVHVSSLLLHAQLIERSSCTIAKAITESL